MLREVFKKFLCQSSEFYEQPNTANLINTGLQPGDDPVRVESRFNGLSCYGFKAVETAAVYVV